MNSWAEKRTNQRSVSIPRLSLCRNSITSVCYQMLKHYDSPSRHKPSPPCTNPHKHTSINRVKTAHASRALHKLRANAKASINNSLRKPSPPNQELRMKDFFRNFSFENERNSHWLNTICMIDGLPSTAYGKTISVNIFISFSQILV